LKKKIVFFGPFVGEFGWELTYWHGWVKRLCKERYRNYYKIACSFPSRYPLYPEVDEFWPLPKKFMKIPISSRGYITDCWLNGFPKPDTPGRLPDVKPIVDDLITEFKNKLPKNTKFVIPWELRYDEEDKRFYGVWISGNSIITYKIPFSKQYLEKLQPTPKGKRMLEKIVNPDTRLIAIFPRCRLFRRPDKNWEKNKYEILIQKLQSELPDHKIAIFGEPGGSFFVDDTPAGCINLVQISSKYRMDVQLAALKQSELALGSQSGGIVFSLAAGCKSLTWGGAAGKKGIQEQNYVGTKLIFYPSVNPTVEVVLKYVRWCLNRGAPPWKLEVRRLTINFLFDHFYRITKSKRLVNLKKSLKLGF